jgi:hypothetical protein
MGREAAGIEQQTENKLEGIMLQTKNPIRNKQQAIT